ncbi:MAG: UDP-N-acetylmuramate dehydrogenase [Armatimonadetes bacterium]|nr:UDP-N-acetylmuramate dehydrogenase [Armatimonadota bacterium]
MQIEPDVSLKRWNTFGIEARAARYARVESLADLQALRATPLFRERPVFILGGGSNILLTRDVDGLVVHNAIGGIRVVDRDADHTVVEAGAGVVWHDLVTFCLDGDLGGLENLSLIPGRVGASPIQNIGAYGVEMKDAFDSLEAMDLATGDLRTFRAEECRFGYRDSVFKRGMKGKCAITSVRFRLTARDHRLNTGYGAIGAELERRGIARPTIRDVGEAVIAIRRSRLPDPDQIGNAGSFFKNPEVPRATYDALKQDHPGLVAYPAPGGMKLAAGWLIEQCGWKGKRVGDAGVHTDHALVLVNYGKATGGEIHALAHEIQASVRERFGIELEMEVNVV